MKFQFQMFFLLLLTFFSSAVKPLLGNEKRVPAKTLLFVQVEIPDSVRTSWKKQMEGLPNPFELAMGFGDNREKMETARKYFSQKLKMDFEEFFALFALEFSLSLTDFTLEGKTPQIELAGQFRLVKPEVLKEKFLMWQEEALKGEKVEYEKKEIRSRVMNILKKGPSSENPEAKNHSFAYCLTEDWLIIGTPAGVTGILETIDSPHASLAELPEFKKVLGNPQKGSLSLLTGFLNVQEIMSRVKTLVPEKKVVDLLEELGLMDFYSLSTRLFSNSDGLNIEGLSLFSMNSLDKGLFKIFSEEDKAQIPSYLPENLTEFSVYNIHLEKLYSVIDKAVSQNFPEKYPFFAMGVSAVPTFTGITLEDLLKSVGHNFTVLSRHVAPFNFQSERKCVVLKLNDPKRIEEVFQTLQDAQRIPPLEKLEYLGRTIHFFTPPPMEHPDPNVKELLGEEALKPGFCLDKNILIFGSDHEFIKDVIRNQSQSPSIEKIQGLAEFRQKLSSSSQMSFTNMEKSVEFVTGLFKNKNIADLIPDPRAKTLFESGILEKLAPLMSLTKWMGTETRFLKDGIELRNFFATTGAKGAR